MLDRRDFSEFGQDRLGDRSIHVYDGNGFARFRIAYAAAQGEIGDVDFVIAENRADFSDHAGDIAIA